MSQPPSKTPSHMLARSASNVVAKVASKVLTKAESTVLQPLQRLTAEPEEYDPHKHRGVPNPTTYSETMTHLIKACIGAGMLAMPNAISRLGLVLGTIGTIFLGFLATYCLQILIIGQYVICKKKKVGYLSYPATMKTAVKEGPPFMRWSANLFAFSVDAFLLLWQIGVCAIFLVFVAENMKQFIAYCGHDVSVRILVCCQYPALVLMCMVKDLKLMAPLSTFSNGCNMIGVFLVFYYLIYDDIDIDASALRLNSLMDIPVFIGTVLYAMEAVGVILALEYNMAEPKLFTGWFGLFSKGMAAITTLYLLLGIFGFLAFGAECKGSITLNLPPEDKKAQAAKLAFASSIFTSFPLQNFVAWQIIWTYIEPKFTNGKRAADMLLRIACSSFPFIMAVAAPTLGPFIGLIGSLCLSMVGILFPAIIDICVYYPDGFGTCFWRVISDILIILLAIFCCISGCYTSLLEMARALE